jgi:hypothetical protein
LGRPTASCSMRPDAATALVAAAAVHERDLQQERQALPRWAVRRRSELAVALGRSRGREQRALRALGGVQMRRSAQAVGDGQVGSSESPGPEEGPAADSADGVSTRRPRVAMSLASASGVVQRRADPPRPRGRSPGTSHDSSPAFDGSVASPLERRNPLEERVSKRWAVLGSNQRPPACRAGALPTELTARESAEDIASGPPRSASAPQLGAACRGRARGCPAAPG